MRTKQLFILRVALLAGVGAFAALSAFQRSRLGNVSVDLMASGRPVPLEYFRYVLWGLAGMALAGAFFLRTRIDVAPPARRGPMLVIGWALGEGVALFGTVQYFIGAPLVTMAIGLMTFVVVLILLPIPPERS